MMATYYAMADVQNRPIADVFREALGKFIEDRKQTGTSK